jgi:predicted  nucleic acid-binding Zn-ribbon protein
MKFRILFLITILFSITATSQTSVDKTIDGQFRDVYKKSNNYQEYKVVLKSAYGILHSNVLDSVKRLKSDISKLNTELTSKNSSISNLEKENTETKTKLDEALSKEDSISLLGIQLSKGMYSIILFAIITILLLTLLFFIYKFNNSNVLTKEAKANLQEAEEELTLFRKKSLEREQKLRRQLQDEINKNRNN